MSIYYLRMEGVNQFSFIYDTKDLSTIRGGGLLLLDAPIRVKAAFSQLTEIATGASQGIFSFHATTDETADVVRADVDAFLRKDAQLKHATFVVDVVPAGDDDCFVPAKERLIAANHWRQMQSLSVAVPSSALPAQQACCFSRVRPVSYGCIVQKGADSYAVSQSVHERRAFGSDQKRGAFYESLTGRKYSNGFSVDLEHLTSDDARGNLNRKMAVIYIDGNQFGKIQTNVCTSAQKQSVFDIDLKTKRQSLLRDLLDEITTGRREGFLEARGRIRLETLLWGGDEILWVVPAWQGWWTLAEFYKRAKDWESIPAPDGKQHPLRHASGLVFCHHSAPIHRIAVLAKELAEMAKQNKNREQNLFAYQALESFDHAGSDLKEFRRGFCPQGTGPEALILDGTSMTEVLAKFALVQRTFPRRKLHAIVKAYLGSAVQSASRSNIRHPKLAKVEDLVKETKDAFDASELSALESLQLLLGGDPIAWVHLAQLWDYLVQE